MEPLKPGLNRAPVEPQLQPQIGSVPKTCFNSWEEITVPNISDRNGPKLSRIQVEGGWLYITTTSLGTEPPTPVFVRAERFVGE